MRLAAALAHAIIAAPVSFLSTQIAPGANPTRSMLEEPICSRPRRLPMAYDAKAVEVFIASPSDVVAERQIVREVIAEWNVIYTRRQRVVLIPVGWETHSAPELAGRPQQMINDRVLEHADLLVGIFWTRIGTPTGESISGTVEEIERHLERGRPVMLYFSARPVVPSSLDPGQYTKLQEFKTWAQSRGICSEFENPDDFRSDLRRHLPQTLIDNRYLSELIEVSKQPTVDSRTQRSPELDPLEAELLGAMALDPNGHLLIAHYIGGTAIQAGSKSIYDGRERREIAKFEDAIQRLASRGLISDRGAKGEVFEITAAGYRAIES